MDAYTFFGINKNSSFYDKRRHVNLFFAYFVQYNLNVNPQIRSFLISLPGLWQSNEVSKAYDVCTKGLLIPIQKEFLDNLRVRLGLSYEEYRTVLTGISLKDTPIKTPVGYSRLDNIKLFIQSVVATMFMQPQVQSQTDLFYDNCIKTFSAYLEYNEMLELISLTNQVADRYGFSIDSILDNMESIENEVIDLM